MVDENKIKKILADSLEMKEEQINENATMENMESWDSLAHLRLIVALEEGFDTKFDENAMIRMVSFTEIKNVLEEKA